MKITTLGNVFARYFHASRNLRIEIRKPGVDEKIESAAKLWQNVTLFVAIPSVIASTIYCYVSHNSHPPQRPEFVPYEYMRVRTTKFPWGDGNHTLFHNKKFNALPEGYEE